MSLAAAGEAVGHSGQAVTMPAARGQHRFTRTKRHLMDWARGQGMAGMYSEATAAHPYSQRANIELGAKETGSCSAGSRPRSPTTPPAGRGPAPVGGDLLREARRRPRAARVRAPPPPRIVARTIELCELRGELADPPEASSYPSEPTSTRDRGGPQSRPDHGPDNRRRTWRRSSPPSATTFSTPPDLDAVYVDLPLRTRRRRWSPTSSSASASPTPASSQTATPTVTSSASSRSTARASAPTISPSPPTTDGEAARVRARRPPRLALDLELSLRRLRVDPQAVPRPHLEGVAALVELLVALRGGAAGEAPQGLLPLFFGLGLTSRHWYPVRAPGAQKEKFAFAAGFPLAPRLRFFPCCDFRPGDFVPFGGPKVAVTVLSPSIVTWQVPDRCSRR